MDILYAIHLFLFGLFLTIPIQPIHFLRYSVYAPLALSIIWLVFQGCPITKNQSGLKSDNFTVDIYSKIIPNITVKTAQDINTVGLILITIAGFYRLKCSNMVKIK
jgi:hypothetical protein